jgi:hypothetical protein
MKYPTGINFGIKNLLIGPIQLRWSASGCLFSEGSEWMTIGSQIGQAGQFFSGKANSRFEHSHVHAEFACALIRAESKPIIPGHRKISVEVRERHRATASLGV